MMYCRGRRPAFSKSLTKIAWSFLAIVPVIHWLSLASFSYAQTNQSAGSDSFAKMLKSEASGLSEASINEILSIRRRLGGGIGLDLDLDQPHFQLEQSPATDGDSTPPQIPSPSHLADRQHSQPRSMLDQDKPDPAVAKTTGERIFYQMLQSSAPLDVGRRIAEQPKRVSSMRQTARLADQLAADLEDLEMYGKADSLRVLASQIRRNARSQPRTARQPRKIR